MIIDNLYPVDDTENVGYPDADKEVELTSRFGVDPVLSMEAYWLGYIAHKTLPMQYCCAMVYQEEDTEDVIIKEITDKVNFPCGYIYDDYDRKQQYRTTIYQNADGTETYPSSDYCWLFNTNFPEYSGLMYKYDRSEGCEMDAYCYIYNQRDQLVYPYDDSSNYAYKAIFMSGGANFIDEIYKFLFLGAHYDATVDIYEDSERKTLHFDITADLFEDGTAYIPDATGTYSARLYLAGFHFGEGAGIEGQGASGPAMTTFPAAFTVKTSESYNDHHNEHIEIGSGYHEYIDRLWYARYNIPTISNPQFLYGVKADIRIPKNAFNSITSVGTYLFQDGVLIHKNDNRKYISGINTIDDIRKSFSLYYRVCRENIASYVAGKTYATDVSPRNEFLARLKTGDIQDETFKKSLRPWQYSNFNVNNFTESDVPGPIQSPYVLSLWSIKETKDDKKVADIFPYNNDDAGDGTFYALVRPKLKYNLITRDENNFIKIEGLSLEFEDAVRRSAWQDNCKIIGFKWNEINKDDDVYEPDIEQGDIIPTSGIGSLVDLTEYASDTSELKQGFYKGQLTSYYNLSNSAYKITVYVYWKNKTSSEPWQGSETIRIINELTGEEVASYLVENYEEKTKKEFNLNSHNEKGEEIPYRIICDLNDTENNWTTTIDKEIVYYDDKKHIVNIVNKWVDVNYDGTVNQDGLIIIKNLFSNLDNNFRTSQDFIAYMQKQTNKNPIIDWLDKVESSREYRNLKTNTAAIFCAEYTYALYQGSTLSEVCFTIVPYITIVIKSETNNSINTFEIFSKIDESSLNLLANDMNKDKIFNNLIWPYISKRNYDDNNNWNLGAEATKLFGRKGNYKNPDGDVLLWSDDEDQYYLDNSQNYEFYIGQPHTKAQNFNYNNINNSIIYSNFDLKNLIINPQLKNFCIFMVDNTAIDCPNENNQIKNIIPYYYLATIIEPINNSSDNNIGIIEATLCFNEKINYWTLDPAPGSIPPSGETYLGHKLYQNSSNNFIDDDTNLIKPNISKIRQAAIENQSIIPSGFLEEYKSIY